MRQRIGWLVAGLVAGLALSGAAVAAGYDLAANCGVADVQLVVHGAAQTPQVPYGGPASFICHGTAYVPVRFIAQALGQVVGWDGATRTISVASAGTRVVAFQPEQFAATETVTGDCWTDSVAAPRAGAYRCMAGNAILDPCFPIPGQDAVACPDPALDPDRQVGAIVQLTAPLPAQGAGVLPQPDPGHPWRLQLANGAMCGAMTGTVVPDHPYGCAPAAGTSAGGASGGLYCTAPVPASEAAGTYTVSCAPLSPQRAANGAPQLATPALYQVMAMWL